MKDTSSDSWRDAFMQRYPRLFRGAGYPSVGDGWQNLLERALSRIMHALDDAPQGASVRIVQIKQKFGTLRLYYGSSGLRVSTREAVQLAVDLAEARSACICELCGEAGSLHDRNGWRTTRCERHAEGEPVTVPPDQLNLYIVTRGKRVVACRRYDPEHDCFRDVPPPAGIDPEVV